MNIHNCVVVVFFSICKLLFITNGASIGPRYDILIIGTLTLAVGTVAELTPITPKEETRRKKEALPKRKRLQATSKVLGSVQKKKATTNPELKCLLQKLKKFNFTINTSISRQGLTTESTNELDPLKCFPKALCGVSSEVAQISKRRKDRLVTDYILLLGGMARNPDVVHRVVSGKTQGVAVEPNVDDDGADDDDTPQDRSVDEAQDDSNSTDEEEESRDSGEDDVDTDSQSGEDDENDEDNEPSPQKKKPVDFIPKNDEEFNKYYLMEKAQMDKLLKETMAKESMDELGLGSSWDDAGGNRKPPWISSRAPNSYFADSYSPPPSRRPLRHRRPTGPSYDLIEPPSYESYLPTKVAKLPSSSGSGSSYGNFYRKDARPDFVPPPPMHSFSTAFAERSNEYEPFSQSPFGPMDDENNNNQGALAPSFSSPSMMSGPAPLMMGDLVRPSPPNRRNPPGRNPGRRPRQRPTQKPQPIQSMSMTGGIYSLVSNLFGYGDTMFGGDPFFQGMARDFSSAQVLGSGIGIDETREMLETAVEVGKHFEKPSQCNELFNACPYEYTELLYMIDDLKLTLRQRVREAEVKRSKGKTRSQGKGNASLRRIKTKHAKNKAKKLQTSKSGSKNKGIRRKNEESRRKNTSNKKGSRKSLIKQKKHGKRKNDDEEDVSREQILVPIKYPEAPPFSFSNMLSWFRI